jgi:hypothetical protein
MHAAQPGNEPTPVNPPSAPPATCREDDSLPDGEGPADFPLPARAGRYRILAKLGAGGFGVVCKGFDEELRREVAVKFPGRLQGAPARQPGVTAGR